MLVTDSVFDRKIDGFKKLGLSDTMSGILCNTWHGQ